MYDKYTFTIADYIIIIHQSPPFLFEFRIFLMSWLFSFRREVLFLKTFALLIFYNGHISQPKMNN